MNFSETVSLRTAVIENFNSTGEVFQEGDYYLLTGIFFLAMCFILLWSLLAMLVYALYSMNSVFHVFLNPSAFTKSS